MSVAPGLKRLTYAMIGGAEGSFIGPIHRMAVRLDDLADLVAGSFSRQSRRNAASAAKFGIDPARVYGNGFDLIAAERGKVDFVVICTTNETHFALAKAALEAGFDVVCEKPLSLTAKEAEELGRLAKRRRRVLAIPFTYTGFPMVKLAHDLVANGHLGSIDRVTIEYVQGSFRRAGFDPHNGWKMNPKIAGPSCVVSDIGVHAFTLVEYVTGLETKSLLADLSSYAPGNRLDDDGSVLLRLSHGAKATMVVSKVATGEENGLRMRVYGSKASLFWNQEAPNYLSVKPAAGPERIYKRNARLLGEVSPASVRMSRFPAGHHEGFVEALANIYDDFVEAVRTRTLTVFPGVREGVRSMRFVEAALKSSKSGSQWVRV